VPAARATVMGYRFSPGVSGCVSQGRAILLDLGRDRYLEVAGPAGEALAALFHGIAVPPGSHPLSGLVAAGLLEWIEGEPDEIGPPATMGAETSLIEAGLPRSAANMIRQLVPASLAVIHCAADVRLRGMARALARSAAQQPPPPALQDEISESRQLHLVAGFRSSIRLMPFAPKCLIGSLALRRVLGRAGIPSQLVIGVLGAPFRAHCWLQQGPMVLNETVDTVGSFTPILVA